MADTISQIITAITPILAPVIVAFFKKLNEKLPKWVLPILASVLGVLIDYVNQFSTGTSLGPVWGAVLGAAGVGVREILDQLKKAIK